MKVIKYPNSILRKKCQGIQEITPEIRKLAMNMMEMMVINQGLGLTASQVGELKRIIVVQTEKGGEENKFSSSPFAAARVPEGFINPKIIKKSKETEIGEEGCLSFPGLFLKIKRAKELEIEALDIEGKKIQTKVEGLTARVFQHEIDHLEGILFIDHVRVGRRVWELLKFYCRRKK